jgi:hypothetical protein
MVALRRSMAIILGVSSAVGIPAWAVRASSGHGSPQIQAPGRPYSGSCSVVLPQAEHLRKGLAVQKQAMERTEALIAAAKGGTPPPSAPVSPAVDTSKSIISSLLSEEAALRKKLEALPLTADASASRARILKDLDRINVGANAVDVLLAAGKYQQAMAEVTSLRELSEATGTYLMDSGLADMLAAHVGARLLGGALGGPAGVLIVQAAALGIDVGARLAGQEISASEVQQAQDTLDALKFQYDAMQGRIQFMVDNCAPESKPQPESSSEPGQPPQPPSSKGGKSAKAGGGSGSNAGKVVAVTALAGGAAVLTGYALNEMRKVNAAQSGCDSSKAPINEINTYCFGSTRNTTLCNQYIAQYDSFCKSCGFSRFDVNQGGCR